MRARQRLMPRKERVLDKEETQPVNPAWKLWCWNHGSVSEHRRPEPGGPIVASPRVGSHHPTTPGSFLSHRAFLALCLRPCQPARPIDEACGAARSWTSPKQEP